MLHFLLLIMNDSGRAEVVLSNHSELLLNKLVLKLI